MEQEHYLDLFEKYIINKATEEEIREMIHFISENPSLHRWIELQIQNAPAEINKDLKNSMLNNIRKEISLPEKSKPSTTIRFKKGFRIAASVILLIGFFSGWYQYWGVNKTKEMAEEPFLIVAGPGEKANMTLPDGTRVWLNSASKLTYYNTYNQKNRLLKLNGEAYFEVAPDAEKIFSVQCVDMKVEVLGTTFGIKAYDEDSIISMVLVEGKVQITLPEKTWVMKPNDRAVYNKSTKKISSYIVKPRDFTDWQKNKLRFENETLQDIAITIARIYNIDYSFEDESIKHIRFTGAVDNTNIESVLNAISLTAPIRYTMKDGTILFHKDNRKEKYFKE
ncbi:iron dicitrate transporter FecR [Bacteroidia bacterium]|nr:iron dicitrate transporter FecR [Bacteroidia bacterium]GHT28707.1 iron dicitrate transporter FecR [Bacteroidia bacterium]GHT85014.1 iron dicitrate transporter FecR [Bacteroidia bacterium]